MGDAAGYEPRPPRPPPPACNVIPIAIKFNHDPNWIHDDAITIRKNASTTVAVPEWELGKTTAAESPAAYALEESKSWARKIKIRAKFIIFPMNSTWADVRTKHGTGGILGAIEPTRVRFLTGVSSEHEFGSETFVPLTLANNRLHQPGGIRREDITWEWEFRCVGETHWHSMGSTSHRIYVLLRAPKTPFDPRKEAEAVWTEVLDHVCVDDASAAMTDTEAMTKITRHTFESHGARYDQDTSGPIHYADRDGNFNLTSYLGQLPNVGLVTCYDGAAAVATFGAAVGCPTDMALHKPFGYLKRIVPVGLALTNNPFAAGTGFAWPGCSKTPSELGALADDDEICRSYFRDHAYARLGGKVFDATMKGQNGWFVDMTQAEYEAAAIDDSLSTDAVLTGTGANGRQYDFHVNEQRLILRAVGGTQDLASHQITGRGVVPNAKPVKIR